MFLFNTATNITLTVVLLIISYLLGSIPNGVVIGKKLTGIDVREHGSKNIGTTNCIRVLGKKVGFLIFFMDVLKGAAIILIVKYLLEPLGIMESPINHICFGIAAIIGHAFPIFLKFKGGKSVATSLGVVFALTPLPAFICLVVFVLFLYTTGYVSICSCMAAIAVVASSWILNAVGSDTLFIIEKPGNTLCIIYSIVAVFLIYKHKTNFKRLLNGTENNFKKKKKAAKLAKEQENNTSENSN